VALCRLHHRAYDRGRLDLVPYVRAVTPLD
jgi:hypothetical protein